MYRDPDVTPECAACRRTSLSPLTLLDPSEGYINLHFDQKQEKRSWAGPTRERMPITRARVCLACGHVMLFLDALVLATLTESLPHLVPVPST